MADTLRELRAERAIRMDALAILSHCDLATISRIETGKVRARDETVVRLAKALGVSARRMRRLCDAARESRSTT